MLEESPQPEAQASSGDNLTQHSKVNIGVGNDNIFSSYLFNTGQTKSGYGKKKAPESFSALH